MLIKEEHQPVLLQEVMTYLEVNPNGVYIDATFGRGGHTGEIVKILGKSGCLIIIDKDPAAIACAKKYYGNDQRVKIYHDSFSNLGEIAKTNKIEQKIDGILLDLGVSSPQLDQAERGFSFLRDGPLDMRMNPTSGISAAQWLAFATEKEIAQVLKDYGEERYARRIAKAINEARRLEEITTTLQLAEIVKRAHPRWDRHKHPATQTFQAIRICINKELEELQMCLEQSLDVLAIGGRLLVISFHSLEDRLVKRFIRKYSREPNELKRLPMTVSTKWIPRLKSQGRGIKSDAHAIVKNVRSRSAVLRMGEKLI